MVQNVERWLLNRDNFRWAREHITPVKWAQIGKYFPGQPLRREMKYVDADTGEAVDRSQYERVPEGRVFLYGYDVQNFLGIPVPGLELRERPARRERA